MRNLTFQLFESLFPGAKSRKYAKNQIICYDGDKPQNVFFVVKGHIKYYDIDESGNEKILHIIGPNNIFPMLYAFGVSKEINGFYASIDTVEVLSAPLLDFQKATETNIEFSNSLTRWFLTEIQQLVVRIESFEKTDAREKVLNTLRYLATDYGEAKGTWQSLNFPVTQQFIADLTGLARETVSSVMQELERDKIVRPQKRHILEINRNSLKTLK